MPAGTLIQVGSEDTQPEKPVLEGTHSPEDSSRFFEGPPLISIDIMYLNHFFCFFCRRRIVGSCVLIHCDSLLIDAFIQTFKVIVDIIGLISTILFTVLYLLLLYFVPVFVYPLSACVVLIQYFIISFSISYTSIVTLFSGCPRVYSVHLQLIQIHF